MSKLPESDWERQKGNPQQQNTVCDNGPKGWYRFEGAAGTRMPTSCSPTHRCNSHLPGWLSGAHPTQADGQVSSFFPLAFRLLLQINYRQSDKLRRLLCLLHKWHTLVSPPLLWNRLNRCWSEKLWILCNRFKNWLHLCVLYFSALTGSKCSMIGHDQPRIKNK